METLASMLRQRCRQTPTRTAYLVKGNGRWQPISWAEVDRTVEALAAGLLSLGLSPGDAVSILGNTRLEWALSDLAALRIGCRSVGIYQTLSGAQSAYVLGDSGSRLLFAENMQQVEKIMPHLHELPNLQWFVVWDDGPVERERVISYRALAGRGREFLARDPAVVARAEQSIDPLDTAIIIYTSGTTGPPKGACLSHRNVLAQVKKTAAFIGEDNEVMMFFLPLSHVGERLPGHYMRIFRGVTAAFVEDITRILDDMKEVRPTVFGSVPRIFEKAYARIRTEIGRAPPWKRRLFDWAERVGRKASRHVQKRERLPPGLRLRQIAADLLVFRKIRSLFGGRVRFFLSAAAPIAVEIIEFFHACGMLILEGYGQTEMSCFCTLCRPDDYRFGSVGKPLPGVELRIAEDGEIMVRGDIVFQGYHNLPELTAETLTPDGWIHSGDLGRIDEDGFLWITGRKKEIIITSGGKNVTPSNIENLLKNDPLIEHAMVHGDRRKYLTALIALAPDHAREWARANGIGGCSYRELAQLPHLQARIQATVDEVNRQLARFETIKKFTILPQPLAVETGELTPTMKVRRHVVEERYRALLDRMYGDV